MKEPVVLLPDMMCDARLFAAQIDALSRDRAVMVAPVHGAERMEDIASAVLSIAPAKCALLGAGLGGMVAMELLRRAPDRITRVALLDTSPLPESPQHAAAREPHMIAARAGRLMDVVEELVPAACLAPGAGRMRVQALLRQMAQDLGPDALVAQTRALQRRRDQQATLRKIRQPCLIACGTLNAIYPPKRHQFMAELVPYAELRMIEGAAHLAALEQPEQFLAVIQEWLHMPLVLR